MTHTTARSIVLSTLLAVCAPQAQAGDDSLVREAFIDFRGESILAESSGKAFDMAKNCQRRRMYVNAVDLLTRCLYSPDDERARKELASLYQNKAAMKALLESGLDIPLSLTPPPPPPAYPPVTHRSWGRAFKVKTDNYTVVTNIDEGFAHSVADAMEQMNKLYRKVFQHKLRGGGTARCTIRIYATRKEFDSIEGQGSASMKGFYSHSKALVATYDPRSDGRDFEKLWSTLFHEASHQFTRMVSTGTIPGWLSEGTASYFEGARLHSNGLVETNLIPRQRLQSLHFILARGKPNLETVISYFQPGSYPASYYPVGWGLAYFMHNYEDEKSNRIYLPLYQKYLKTYKSGGKHDPVARFEQYFIRNARQDDVKTLEDFESRFTKWMEDLYTVEFGQTSPSEILLARAKTQHDNRKFEYAAATYLRLLKAEPDNVTALVELADVQTELKNKDLAFYCLRRALEISRGDRSKWTSSDLQLAGDPTVLLKKMKKVDSNLTREMDTFFEGSESTVAVAEAYLQEGQRDAACVLLDRMLAIYGSDEGLSGLRQRIRDEGSVVGSPARPDRPADSSDSSEM